MVSGKTIPYAVAIFGITAFSFSAGLVHGAAVNSSISSAILFQQQCDAGAISELCAQWAGVAATEEAARWAYWQMIFSALGVFGLAVTLAFNYAAWAQARKSENEAREALASAPDPATSPSDIETMPATSLRDNAS